MATNYLIARDVELPFGEAVGKVRELLQEAGYGIFSEIDVKAGLEEKIGIEREPYVILGACNPPLARQGLDAEPAPGALLPCNAPVYEREGRTRVAAVEPGTMLSVAGNDELEPIAEQVREDLTCLVDELAKGRTVEASR